MLDAYWGEASRSPEEEVFGGGAETGRGILRHRCQNWGYCFQCLNGYSACPRCHQREGFASFIFFLIISFIPSCLKRNGVIFALH